ncbi:sodium:alanine symporter family protein [Paenibacillus thiaminolyticus]|uniref:Sodium:alanine symporter family protein n=1 Tax=Paenibacillus thiaminolyticus TaxID=49283 RepID=A0AAP9DQU5_PANTH|nr:sodium:alanine symporter family protein [Paenibacillus thiaminolyticus]MCY9537302.1 sodium:alanine symporter family protein [Paenibacillus thiaminolyticus]MCY9603654.1 sodium:alanine symporter family protein [Paenibacillus thiaminolyticus]MCY9606734.1 sodium:alanine symporter family protein [Paenibacillus thiaminolyticus]MCY9612812.1 sodium:alanine symporter family protein [Paenibacillus thiaminolyticus]MCY9619698.1 sodium:alanine symporter family protein [Paenibacillus thiaminolyticus]
MHWLEVWLDRVNQFVWGPPLLILLVGTGIFLTIRLGLLQVLRLPLALKLIFTAKNEGKGDVTSFGALATALAATIGTGNIVGVATAIQIGGPGALFWMWLAAFFGMATKYAEGLLAVKFRKIDENGQVSGGPMYYIEQGLGAKFKPLAIYFAVSGVLVALLGIGTLPQVNAIVSSSQTSLGIPVAVTAGVVTLAIALVTIGGLKSIARVTTKVVPAMAIIYVVASVIVLITFADKIPNALSLVFQSAFSPAAAGGGFLGATVMMAIRNGIARGVFSNESGLGSAPIAAAAAKVKWPAEQGLVSMTGTFIDTIIICTLTGLTLIVTGAWNGMAEGAAMTQAAFDAAMPFGSIILTICLMLFAFTTILGWNYYGERCIVYLFGVRAILPYRIVFIAMVAAGAFIKLHAIYLLSDIVNGLMALPNLVALLGLSGVVVAETRLYLRHMKQ